jgi:hypothetical protein
MNLRCARSRGIFLRKFAALENALHNAAAEHGERALRHGFANRRRNHGPHRSLRLQVGAAGCSGMLQQRSQQRAFLSAQNPLIPH